MYFKLTDALENLLASRFWTFKQLALFSWFFCVINLWGADMEVACISHGKKSRHSLEQ